MIRKAWLGLASAAGTALRAVAVLPGLLAAVSICYGLGLIYWPLTFISAGVFLLLLDWRLRE